MYCLGLLCGMVALSNGDLFNFVCLGYLVRVRWVVMG